jgi:ribosomal protein S27AE
MAIAADQQQIRRCPYCAKEVTPAALVCQHCGRAIVPPEWKEGCDRWRGMAQSERDTVWKESTPEQRLMLKASLSALGYDEPPKEEAMSAGAVRVVTLKCSSCGAALEIAPDMSRFACGYCGAALAVERRGGTVALKGVEEAVARVQVGTDKTAAELAIARLTRELETEKAAWAACDADISSRNPHYVAVFLGFFFAGSLCLALMGAVGVLVDLLARPSQNAMGATALLMIAGVAALLSGILMKENQSSYQSERDKAWRPHGARIAQLQAQIDKAKAIVNH